MNKKIMLLCAVLPLSGLLTSAYAADKGKIGLSLDIAVEGGFFNPTLANVKVKSLVPGAAAEKAGLLVGDQILKIDDCVIPGCPADDAKSLMKKERGGIVTFLVKQADGVEVTKVVVAE